MLFRFVPFGVAPESVPFRYSGGSDELLLRIALAAERIANRLEAPADAPTSARDSPSMPALLDVAEVAQWLRLTPKGVYGLVESGRLPHVRVANRVRFERDAVLRWLAKSRVSSIGSRR